RGGPTAQNFGVSRPFVTNTLPVSSNGTYLASSNVISLTNTEGTLVIDYDFFGIPDDLRVYYDGDLLFDTGLISGAGTFSVEFGPGVSTNLVVVMNEGDNNNQGTLWNYTAAVITGRDLYFTFTENTNLAQIPVNFADPLFP